MRPINNYLELILSGYDALASSDPNKLRHQLPSKEIWRFFIDGIKQGTGRGLKQKSSFKPQPIYFQFFFQNRLKYSVNDYIKFVEKAEKYEGVWLGSTINTELREALWNLNDTERDQFTLESILKMDKAWLPFERNEPGYLAALYKAFAALFDFEKILTVGFIKKLHYLATFNVANTQYVSLKEPYKLDDFRSLSQAGYGLMKENVSAAGLVEFINDIKCRLIATNDQEQFLYKSFGNELGFRLDGKFFTLIERLLSSSGNYNDDFLIEQFIHFAVTPNESRRHYCTTLALPLIKKLLQSKTSENVAHTLYENITSSTKWFQASNQAQMGDTAAALNNRMQHLLDTYHADIKCAIDMNAKLTVIIKYIRSCSQLHPFSDGNVRTHVMLLLNHLLMQNGFPPAILSNPNVFELFSSDEILHAVLEGMQNTLTLIRTGTLYGITTDAVLADLRTIPNTKSMSDYFDSLTHFEEAHRQVSDKTIGHTLSG